MAGVYTIDDVLFHVDWEDLERVRSVQWQSYQSSRSKKRYVRSTSRRPSQELARFILGLRDRRLEADHIDGDPLNNRRSNLRVCTRRQNAYNQGIRSNNTSGFKGVSYSQSRKKWVARIRLPDGSRPELGGFDSPEAAGAAYKTAAERLHGSFARVSW